MKVIAVAVAIACLTGGTASAGPWGYGPAPYAYGGRPAWGWAPRPYAYPRYGRGYGTYYGGGRGSSFGAFGGGRPTATGGPVGGLNN